MEITEYIKPELNVGAFSCHNGIPIKKHRLRNGLSRTIIEMDPVAVS